MHNKLF